MVLNFGRVTRTCIYSLVFRFKRYDDGDEYTEQYRVFADSDIQAIVIGTGLLAREYEDAVHVISIETEIEEGK